ncbi:MAG TPA: copper resistance protein NlpE N-terminal domain-containing protein [Flavobacterium sp.]|jgi:heat shock protein HslJ
MKKIVLLTVLAVTFSNCTRKAKDPLPAPTEVTSDTTVKLQTGAQNSLNYLGMYKGKLPCADCAGIETSLQLSEGFSYTLTRKYLGKSTKVVETKGSFSWNDAGNAIVLENIKGEPNQYFVSENALTQLDLDGNKTTGKLAENYILRKVPEAQAAQTDAPVKEPSVTLAGTRWELAELNAKPVTSKSEREFSIDFRTKSEFGAYAGCNSIGGKYEYKGDKIKLFNIMSTRMACAEMDVETTLIAALESADNFVQNDKVLQLRKGGMILAKFDAFPETK